MSTRCEVLFNPSCSKCRAVREILESEGIDAVYREYLTAPLSRAELARVLELLGGGDPRAMTRTGDALYSELGLATASRDALLDALAAHPKLIERPIVILGDRAVVARPPEVVRDLLRGAKTAP